MDYKDFYNIVRTKQNGRDELDDLKNLVSVFLYKSILDGKTLSEIRKGVSDLADKSGLPRIKRVKAVLTAETNRLYKICQTPTESRSEFVFSTIDKTTAFKGFDEAASQYLNDEEARGKEEILDKALEEPADISSYKAFCLCSRHDDCAEDHKPYQGKLYVKRWALRYPEIKEFCDARGIKTVEWVIGKPAWLTTRPNCRHFFTELTAEEAMGQKIDWLLKSHGMDRAVGTRSTQQNIKHSTRKQWYTEENVTRTIQKYRKRLRKHERMAEVFENENLKNAIGKDRFLIRKWELYLAKIKK